MKRKLVGSTLAFTLVAGCGSSPGIDNEIHFPKAAKVYGTPAHGTECDLLASDFSTSDYRIQAGPRPESEQTYAAVRYMDLPRSTGSCVVGSADTVYLDLGVATTPNNI